MSLNRLFLYDPKTNTAVCIAKGYSNGWRTYGDSDYQNKFYDHAIEYTGALSKERHTRIEVRTEDNLPECEVIYADHRS